MNFINCFFLRDHVALLATIAQLVEQLIRNE